MPRSLPLVVSTLAFAGCHLVFGHHPGAPGSEGDGAVRFERGVVLDGGRLDRLFEVGAAGDRARTDKTCNEALPPPVAGFTQPCPQSLTSCPEENADCDGLAGGVDPYADCNERVYEEEFARDVIAGGSWSVLPASSWSWSCGALAQTSTANSYATAYLKIPPPLPAGYLVEARVTLGQQGPGSHWRAG